MAGATELRITLIYPPDAMLPTVPFASLPAVTACLRQHGHEVKVRDLNLELVPELLRRDRLEAWYDLAHEHARRLGSKPVLSEAESRELWRLQRLLAVPRSIFAGVQDALAVMQDRRRFLDPECFNRAFDALRGSQRFALNISPWCFTEAHGSIADVLAIHDAAPLPDPPVDFLVRTVDSLLADSPDVIAATLPWNPSLFYGLKLLALIKQRAPQIPVIIGGSGLDSHAFPVLKDPAWFAAFDYALEGRAEEQLPVLIDALAHGTDPTAAKNLYYLKPDRSIGQTPQALVEDLNRAPPPDFSNLALDKYLLPDPVATFQTSLGCYYGKCTFCSELFRKNFRMRRPDLVVDDMIRIHETTGITHFQIWDSLAPPKMLRHVAEQIHARGLPFKWMAETKFEKPYLNESMVETLARGGCVFLFFGFESGSERVLELVDKGNDLPTVDRILDNLRRHGIRACTSWFIGFPGETEAEADTTYDFVALRRDRILFSNYTRTFGIGTDTIAYKEQERFGIEVFEDEQGGLDYRYRDGTPHWDQRERDESFRARGDFHQINNHVEVHYSGVDMAEALKITGQGRMGPLLRHVIPGELDRVRFRATPECSIKDYERHPYRPLSESQGHGVVYNIVTGHAFELHPDAHALLRELRRPVTLEELGRRLAKPRAELLKLLDLAINRGMVRIDCEEHQLQYRPEAQMDSVLAGTRSER